MCGVGSEFAFGLHGGVPGLDVARMGARRAPVSASPVLEGQMIPDAQRIAKSAQGLLARHGVI